MAIRKFKPLLKVAALLAFASVSLAAVAETHNIRIHIVDGRNGKTITDERVRVWIFGRIANILGVSPWPNGITTVDASGAADIDVAANLYRDCRPIVKDAHRPSYPVYDIERFGVVTANTCGKVKSEPKPGELIFYVRPYRSWERMKQ